MMRKLLTRFISLFAVLASIATVVGLYLQWTTHDPKIEIKTLAIDKLTDFPSVDGLVAKFTYKDSTVNSLWKLNYLIENIGSETIIGEGNKKNIIKDSITFFLPDNFKILEIRLLENNFPFNYSAKKNQIKISFLQWKPKEHFRISIFAEQVSNTSPPFLRSNEREIINAEVKYSTVQPESSTRTVLADYLPSLIREVIWWLIIVFYGFLILIVPIGIIQELLKQTKFKKWQIENAFLYEDWITELIQNSKIKKAYSAKELPKKYWDQYPYLKPEVPDTSLFSLIIAAMFIVLIFGGPLLWMFKI